MREQTEENSKGGPVRLGNVMVLCFLLLWKESPVADESVLYKDDSGFSVPSVGNHA